MMSKSDKILGIALGGMTFLACSILIIIIGYVFKEAAGFLLNVSFFEFLTGSVWDPANTSTYQIGPLISGTVAVAALGLFFSLPTAIGLSLLITLYTKNKIQHFLIKSVDMLAGIPSIIIGFVGLTLLVPFLAELFNMSSGESTLAGGLVVGFMMLPYELSTISQKMIKSYRRYHPVIESLAVSKLYGGIKIILPSAKTAILSASMQGLARGLGETMAVMLVIGNANLFPGLLTKTSTIAGRIALEMGMAVVGSEHYQALFAAAFILMTIVLLLNLLNIFLQYKLAGEYDD